MSHLYLGLENVGLSAAQRQTLVDYLRSLGDNLHPQPSHRNHVRIRLDGQALIVHCEFDATTIRAVTIRNRLASVFGVANTSISYVTTHPTFGTLPSDLVTFSYGGQAKLRILVFGGTLASNAESNQEVLAYLAANSSAWEPVE